MERPVRLGNALALGGALLLSACGGEGRGAAPISSQASRTLANVHVDPAAATAMLTSYRASHGLGPVRLDAKLTTMAQRQADAMVRADELSHDVEGSFGSRIVALGVDTPRAAENIGGGYYSAEEAFRGWRDSPEHDANLLIPQATRFGIAIAKDPRTRLRIFWVMEVAADPDRPPAGGGS